MRPSRPSTTAQQGATLVIALVFLVALTLIALSAAVTSMMDERQTRNTRDSTVATEGAEAALAAAEAMITSHQIIGDTGFVDCTDSSATGGLCQWTANNVRRANTLYESTMDQELSNPASVKTQALADWPAPTGVKKPQTPRFYIEVMRARQPGADATAEPGESQFLYRVTARGFGHNPAVYVTQESVYRSN